MDIFAFCDRDLKMHPSEWNPFFNKIATVKHMSFGVSATGGTVLWRVRIDGKRTQFRIDNYRMRTETALDVIFHELALSIKCRRVLNLQHNGLDRESDLPTVLADRYNEHRPSGQSNLYNTTIGSVIAPWIRSELAKLGILENWLEMERAFEAFIAQGKHQAKRKAHDKVVALKVLKRSIQTAYSNGIEPEDIQLLLHELAAESVLDA